VRGDGSEAGEGGGGGRWGSRETYGTPGSGGVAEYLKIDHRINLNQKFAISGKFYVKLLS
jgi:hypothetical protein